MGKELHIAVEVYDRTRRRWSTITVSGLRAGKIIPFDQAEALERARKAILDENPEVDPHDLEEEALNETEGEFAIHIDQNYDLFTFLADAGHTDNPHGIIQQSGTRGPPLDSSTDRRSFGSNFASFLTLSELLLIDWKQRINTPDEIPIEKYDDNVRPTRGGRRRVIFEADWLAADENARFEYLRSNLRIQVDKPLYLSGIDDFLGVLADMQQLPGDPNDIRLIMIFTY